MRDVDGATRRRRPRGRDRPSLTLVRWWRATWSNDPLDPDERRIDRRLGRGRFVGGLALAASLWTSHTDEPGWVAAMAVAGCLGLVLSGVETARVMERVERPRRELELLSLLDAVLLSMLLPFGAGQDNAFTVLVFLLLALSGSVRLGRFGVLRNLVVAAPFETVRLVLAASLFGSRHVEDTVVAVVVAAGVGVIVGDLSTNARRLVAIANDAERRRDHLSRRVRRSAWEADVVDDVVRVAGTGRGPAALARAVTRVRDGLHVANAHLLVGSGSSLVVWATTDPALVVGRATGILPGGPLDRALSLGTVAAATHDDLDRLAARGDHHGSLVAAPVLVGGRLLGLLVVATDAGDLLHRRDALVLGKLGRAMAPFLWVAGPTPPGSGDAHQDDRSPGDGRSVEQGRDEGVGIEDGQVVDAFAQADQLHR